MCMDLAACPSGERAAKPALSASDIRRLSATVISAAAVAERTLIGSVHTTNQRPDVILMRSL